jgi:Uroporphyrinogen decarboxylase (URO-D)
MILSPREALLTTFADGHAGRPAWFADLSYWHSAHMRLGDIDPRWADDGIAQLHREMGCGLYLAPTEPFLITFDCDSERRVEPPHTITIHHTPHGDLREVITDIPEALTWDHTEHLLRSEQDLPALQWLVEHMRYEPDLEAVERRDAITGEIGVPVVCAPRSPLARLFVVWAGIEAASLALFAAPDAMRHLLETLDSKDDAAYELCKRAPSPLVMIPDNLSADVWGPAFFREHAGEVYRRRATELREAGKIVVTHLDGRIRGLIGAVAETGIDGIEGLTPAPLGDLDVEQLREAARRPDTVLWGGIPGLMFTPHWSDADFDAAVRRAIEVFAADPRTVLGVGDQVPPDGLLTRVERVGTLVDEVCGNP